MKRLHGRLNKIEQALNLGKRRLVYAKREYYGPIMINDKAFTEEEFETYKTSLDKNTQVVQVHIRDVTEEDIRRARAK